MRKDDIINKLSRKMLDKAQAKAAFEHIFEIIKEGLEKDGKVVISRFGTFRLVRTRPVVRHNPKTLQAVSVPAKRKIRFKPSDSILDKADK
ncbi:DNA-binding protein HU-beta [Parelusimicrobium proximum]|uniref:HU family DNA-binding protein n=1 Tax=Parelusimicrobium proximum TaxID=3228953 RepID=UPI003D1666F8